MSMRRRRWPWLPGLVAASLAVPAVAWGTGVHATSRLDDIRNRGHVICGVLPGIPGFAVREPGGRYRGLEIDFCRALAAAVLGDAEKVEFLVVRTVDEFKENHSVDVAVRRLTWTLRREAETGLLFGPVIFHDGAGFLVRRGIDDAHGLAERPVCVRSGSEANRALVGFARARDVAMRWRPTFPSLPAPGASWTRAIASFPSASPRSRWRRSCARETMPSSS